MLLNGAEKWLEPYEGRLSRTVLRGRRCSNAPLLPDQVHGIDHHGKVMLKKQLKRAQMAPLFINLPPCLIGMEACGSAHHWARKLQPQGVIHHSDQGSQYTVRAPSSPVSQGRGIGDISGRRRFHGRSASTSSTVFAAGNSRSTRRSQAYGSTPLAFAVSTKE